MESFFAGLADGSAGDSFGAVPDQVESPWHHKDDRGGRAEAYLSAAFNEVLPTGECIDGDEQDAEDQPTKKLVRQAEDAQENEDGTR